MSKVTTPTGKRLWNTYACTSCRPALDVVGYVTGDDILAIEREAAAAERKRLQDDAREFHRVAHHPAAFERCQTAQCAALQAMLWDIAAKEAERE